QEDDEGRDDGGLVLTEALPEETAPAANLRVRGPVRGVGAALGAGNGPAGAEQIGCCSVHCLGSTVRGTARKYRTIVPSWQLAQSAWSASAQGVLLRQRVGSCDNLEDLLRDLGLTGAVHREGEGVDTLPCRF